ARIDGLLPFGATEAVALAGSTSSHVRYLPHDGLLLLTRRGRPAWRLTLPPYVTPPGLASGYDHTVLYVVVDNAVLVLNAATGRPEARHRLDVQALGWPAAVAAGPGGRLYVAGQPARGWAAMVEALAVEPSKPARVVWRAQLGLFHAGIWLGPAGPGRLVVYLPGPYDTPGTIAVLDERSGILHPAYAVPAPPLAADPAGNRLYVAVAGAIRALTLDPAAGGSKSLLHGAAVAAVPGAEPLALDVPRGLVAFARGDGIVLASARTLRPLARLALHGATALATTPDGSMLLVGRRGSLAWIGLRGCRG
ncbi:MAG TPA: hypothetical protein VKF37_16405, partial [Chloroflexota bacterium]|nr:hypothetical protein [Chloroflexota bacterium]